MTDKTTIVNLLPGQVLDIRTERGQQVTYPEGKTRPKRILTRDLGTWVEPEPPPVEPPPVEPPPVTPPPTGKSLTVTSIATLLSALDDDTLDEIVVKNGTYTVSAAASKGTNSLWIGSRFADRTKPILVRAETPGGVTLDGAGTKYFGAFSFEEGAHHQTWDGFKIANGEATQTGVITYGGYPGLAAAHHITMKRIDILPSVLSDISNGVSDHAFYFSQAVGGPHDLLLEDINVKSTDQIKGLGTALHFYHSDATNKNAWNVTVRRLTADGLKQTIMFWDRSLHDILIEDTTIKNSAEFGVRYELCEADSAITLRRVTTTGSGSKGFYSGSGTNPPGITFIDCSFG